MSKVASIQLDGDQVSLAPSLADGGNGDWALETSRCESVMGHSTVRLRQG